MNVLVISPYPREGASFRFRVLQYLPELERRGIHAETCCFLTSREFQHVHRPRGYLMKGKAVAAGTRRLIAALARAKRFDAILVHREVYPLGIEWFERWVGRLGVPVILDVDDAIFLPQPHSDPTRRRFHNPHKLVRLAVASRLILVSNEYLGRWFRQHNARVTVLPTTVDTEQFQPGPSPRQGGRLTIGWIGSPSTAGYFRQLLPVFKRLRERAAFDVKVVGAGSTLGANGLPLIQVPWELEREVEQFQSIDIGVYPLSHDEWAEGKGGFKSLQYMAVGIPVVASPVGVNCDIIRPGQNGFLASREEEWMEILGRLLQDAPLRQRVGQAGRQTVVERYATAVHAPRLAACLEEAVRS